MWAALLWTGPVEAQVDEGCVEDHLEPNRYEDPTLITGATSIDGLSVCASDDWYRLHVLAGQVVTIGVLFTHADGDLDMTIHGDHFEQLALSDSALDGEALRYVARQDATITVRVYGYNGATNSYRLSVGLRDYSTACPHRPEDQPGSWPVAGTLCVGQQPNHQLAVAAGSAFDVTLFSDPGLGDLDLQAFDRAGRLIGSSATPGAWDRVRIPPGVDAPVTIQVSGHAGGFGPYSLSLTRLDPGSRVEVSGVVSYERDTPQIDGSRGRDRAVPEGVVVELVSLEDGAPVARAQVGSGGEYHLVAPHTHAEDLYLRVLASVEHGRYSIAVVADRDAAVHSGESAPLDRYLADGGPVVLNAHFPVDHPMAGALNIATVARRGFEVVRTVQGAALPPVEIVWSPGLAHACGSCYTGERLWLGGGEADPDEFDDVVILHELAHFFIDHLSVDQSPGGDHDGSRTRPLVAFAEGAATAFAILITDSPVYLDSTGLGIRVLEDVESIRVLHGRGTSDGTWRGLVSEWLLGSLVWDLYDEPNSDEPNDGTTVGRTALLRVFTDVLVRPRRPDVGSPGADTADWLNSFRCSHPFQAAAAVALSRRDLGFRFPDVAKAKCEWR